MSLILAHRGASGHYPENTILAFKEAIKSGCDGIELDIHLTADQHLVVCHDFTVSRTTNGKGLISSYTLDELKKLDAGSWYDPLYSDQTIPTLREVLTLFKPTSLIINIELKAGSRVYPGIESQVLALVKSYDMLDRVMFSSFDHEALVVLRQLSQDAYLGILYGCCLIDPWEYAKKLDANALHPYYLFVDKKLVDESNHHGLEINTYTVNTLREMQKLQDIGVHSIITNYPELKKELT